MQITTPRKLCELQLPSGPIVGLYQEDSRFYAKQELPDGESFVVEITDPAAAYKYYLFAADAGKCLSSFPGPVPQPDPPDESEPALSLAGEARRIRRAAGVTLVSLAMEIGVHPVTIAAWERVGARLNETLRGSNRTAELRAKFQRYVEALATMEDSAQAPERDLAGAKVAELRAALVALDAREEAAAQDKAARQRKADAARLAELQDSAPLTRPRPVAASPDGKRRCSHPGCDTILSRFNDGDRCACHE